MNLPIPTDEEIEKFRVMYKKEYGIILTFEDAASKFTHVLQFYFLTKGHELTRHNQAVRKAQEEANRSALKDAQTVIHPEDEDSE